MARSATKRFPAALRVLFRYILDAGIWMALAYGALPAEIITQRNEGKPLSRAELSRVEPSRVELSRAERRQWERLVRQIR